MKLPQRHGTLHKQLRWITLLLGPLTMLGLQMNVETIRY